MINLLRLIKPYRVSIAFVTVLTFLQAFANLLLPTLMADIVDNGIVRGDTGHIFRIGGIKLPIALAGTACAVAGSFFSARIAIGFGRIIRQKVFANVANFSLLEFDTFGTASLITRTTNDTTQVQRRIKTHQGTTNRARYNRTTGSPKVGNRLRKTVNPLGTSWPSSLIFSRSDVTIAFVRQVLGLRVLTTKEASVGKVTQD